MKLRPSLPFLRNAARLTLAAGVLATLAACKPSTPEATAPAATDTPAPAATPVAPKPRAVGGLVPAELDGQARKIAMVPMQACGLDRVNGAPFPSTPVEVAATAPIRLAGWFADIDGQSVPESLMLRLRLEGTPRVWQVEAKTGVERDGVATLHGATFLHSGYRVEIDPSTLPAGSYRLFAALPQGDGVRFCGTGATIVLRK